MSVVLLSHSACEQIRQHGEEAYPNESCGVLLGDRGSIPWQITTAVRAVNTRTDSAHNRYSIAPHEIFRIDRAARHSGLEIAGFYHSHPDHPAHWSTTDLAEAHWLGCLYLITEVAQGKAAASNCFLLAGPGEEEKHFEPVPLQIHPHT